MTDHSPEAPRSCCTGSTAVKATALVLAVLVSALLAFTAYAKAFHPNPKAVEVRGLGWTIDGAVFDRAIAGFEVVVLLLLLALHRRCWAWALNALFFAGLGGYGAFKSWHGESCGCFAKLFDPPPYSMAAVDAVIVAFSIGMALWLGMRRSVLPALLVAVVGAGAAGWFVSQATTPPRRAELAERYEGKTAIDRLVESAWMADLREQPEGGPAWLVYAYDPDCEICRAMAEMVDFYKSTWEETGDPIVQLRKFSIPEMQRELGIESFAWETPTLFVFVDGRATHAWRGNQLEGFGSPEPLQDISDRIASGEFTEPDDTLKEKPRGTP